MRCPAKLNLSLHLLGKRQDGFTELDSVVAFLDWHDDLIISLHEEKSEEKSPSGSIYFSSNDKTLEALGEANLVHRGIRAVQKHAQESHHQTLAFPAVDVYLEKCLPYQAGLGSASSNAATAIRLYHDLLCHRFQTFTPLSLEELSQLGASIGSDVPLFLKESPLVQMQGRGERTYSIQQNAESSSFTNIELLILKSNTIAIATKEAYAWVHESHAYSQPDPAFLDALEHGDSLKDLVHYMHNDFEAVVFKKHPHLVNVKTALLKTGAFHVLLCGSGSAIVGFFDADKIPSLSQQKALEVSFDVRCWHSSFLCV